MAVSRGLQTTPAFTLHLFLACFLQLSSRPGACTLCWGERSKNAWLSQMLLISAPPKATFQSAGGLEKRGEVVRDMYGEMAGRGPMERDMAVLYNSLQEGGARRGQALLPSNSERTRGNGFKLSQESFRSDSGENFFTERMVSPWNRLPKTVRSHHPWRGLKGVVDMALEDMV